MHCIQYDRYLIVSDHSDHCIKVFDRKGKFQYKFGEKGAGDGEFSFPECLSVNKSDKLWSVTQAIVEYKSLNYRNFRSFTRG